MPAVEEPTRIFSPTNPRVSLLVFLLASAAIGNRNYIKINCLWWQAVVGQGHQLGVRPHPPTFVSPSKSKDKPPFALRRRSPRLAGILDESARGHGIASFGVESNLCRRNPPPYFRHLKPARKDYKRSNEGGLFMLVTATGS
ncbi:MULTISPECIES: hypothetical protein [unclassified Bradyrhizobium]|uniref:hypothetical protein n=1 Tax=unclassified Bradyrhizobium TaxID=2631580 RepID=UPI002916E88E|nr:MULTISPECIES: hypothetical protein [unclassified Bradyrhizobium]